MRPGRLRLFAESHGLLVAVHKVQDLGKGGQGPAAGVQQVQRRDGVEVGKDGVHPDHTEHAGAHHHDDGGHHGLAQPAGGGNGAVHEGGDAVGKGHHGHALHAGVDDSALGGEQRQKGAAEEEQGTAQCKPHAEGVAQTDEVAFLDAVGFAGTVVLAHEAGAGHVEGGHAVVDHVVGVGGSAVALDHEGVKGVDAGLDEQVGDGKNGVLEPGRHPQGQDALGGGRVQVQLVYIQRVAVLRAGQCPQDQRGRDALGDGTGQRHAHHAQAADDDEEQVQHDVQRARKGQIDQGLFGVADGAEHRIAEVVQRQRRHAQKIHPQVQDGTGQQVVLGVEQPQHEGRTQQADEQQRHTGDQADDGGRVHRLLHIGGVPGPVKACHQHVDAVAQADKETGEQGDQNAGGAHGTQRRGPGEPAHDRHVRHVKQYLQQVGQGQRQADQQNLLGQRAFRQGFGG